MFVLVDVHAAAAADVGRKSPTGAEDPRKAVAEIFLQRLYVINRFDRLQLQSLRDTRECMYGL